MAERIINVAEHQNEAKVSKTKLFEPLFSYLSFRNLVRVPVSAAVILCMGLFVFITNPQFNTHSNIDLKSGDTATNTHQTDDVFWTALMLEDEFDTNEWL